MTVRVAGASAVAVALLLTASCGSGSQKPAAVRTTPEPDSTCHGFALSLASDRGGQPSPLSAARWFVVHGGVDEHLPRSGWREDGRDATGAILRSDGSTLHALQGSDKTWQVDSGNRC